MCKCDCQHPEIKPKDEKCCEEQIKECHGDVIYRCQRADILKYS